MKYSLALAALGLASNAMGAYVGSSAWTTLTPSKTLSDAATSFSGTFGIAIHPVSSGSNTTPTSATSLNLGKRDVVSQIGDGQIQATTSTKATEAKTTSTKNSKKTTSAEVVSQISDGQIQETTSTKSSSSSSSTKEATSTADAVVSQITDGQIQGTTSTKKSDKKTTSTADAVVSQITDGQIQATTSTSSKEEKKTSTAADVVSQIGDGQIQATTSTSPSKKTSTAANVVSQISDGQLQGTSSSSATKTTATTSVVSQISDGQIQATSSASSSSSDSTSSSSADASDYITEVACLSDGTLAMTLEDGILKDSQGRIGSIVANRQFQFDGPPPQAGAIYANGWSISEDGYLAIGDETTFYQCLSGTFYNLYDESIGSQCSPVHLRAVALESC